MKRPKLNGHAAIAEAVGNSLNEYLEKLDGRTCRQSVRAGDWRCRKTLISDVLTRTRAISRKRQGCSASIAYTACQARQITRSNPIKRKLRRANIMNRKITRALLSVSDKSGLLEFATALSAHGVELLSTGGTAKLIPTPAQVIDVGDYTGFLRCSTAA